MPGDELDFEFTRKDTKVIFHGPLRGTPRPDTFQCAGPCARTLPRLRLLSRGDTP